MLYFHVNSLRKKRKKKTKIKIHLLSWDGVQNNYISRGTRGSSVFNYKWMIISTSVISSSASPCFYIKVYNGDQATASLQNISVL